MFLFRLGVKKSLLVLSSLGYTVQSPPIDHLKRDLGHTLVPFRTFRGQFISYCTGSGKWYVHQISTHLKIMIY